MFIQVFPSGPYSTNAYLAVCPATLHTAIIDPAPSSFEKISSFIKDRGFVPKAILLTHSHWDHIADVAAFQAAYSIPVYIHSLDVPNLEKPGADGLPFWIPISPVKPDVLFEENGQVQIGHLNFQVIHTPGHSPGSSCFYEKSHGVLFSGDTLFQGTMGNVSFPTSEPKKMRSSLAKLSQLPQETRVLPGHGDETTIGKEANWLPSL